MSQAVVGGINRVRKNGSGEMIVMPELIQQIKKATPQWKELRPQKIANMLDRALPGTLGDEHIVTLSLPGGKQIIQIPISVQRKESTSQIDLHFKKPITIKDC